MARTRGQVVDRERYLFTEQHKLRYLLRLLYIPNDLKTKDVPG